MKCRQGVLRLVVWSVGVWLSLTACGTHSKPASSNAGSLGFSGTFASAGNAGSGGTSRSVDEPGPSGTGGSGGSAGSSGTLGSAGSADSSGPFGLDGNANSGVSDGSSGTSGGDAPVASCNDVTPCGGEVLGTWSAAESCLKMTGEINMGSLGLGCASGSITGTLQVTGTWTLHSDGTYLDETTTSGNVQLELPAECLTATGTITTCDRLSGRFQALGYASTNCIDAANGGCTCSATVQQSGGIGVVSESLSASGTYTTGGNKVTISDGISFSYCVDENTMTVTPRPTTPTTTGAIVFLKEGSSDSGGTGGTGGAGGTGGSAGSTANDKGPCDIYAASSPATPCVAAYSTVRRLSSAYSGPLYQVRKGGDKRGTGGRLQDIGMIDGFADGTAQDAFCGTDTCTVSILYDQSGKGNDLTVAPGGCYDGGNPPTALEPDYESDAKKHSLTISGRRVYALYMVPHDGYRNNNPADMPTGSSAQGIYEVADGKRPVIQGCCWNFGNASRDNCFGPTGVMASLLFGKAWWDTGAGGGPWFMGDFEAGVWAGGTHPIMGPGGYNLKNENLPSSNVDYAFGILKTSTNGNTPRYALRVGDAQSGGLTTGYDGEAPAKWQMGGGIVLGIGGDNSNWAGGTFFEGAITAGRPSDDTDLLVLQNVQAAGYGK
ncbi:MAG: hypothetical protein JXA30_07070 [Deltaproteobacteria bacterium]|nr:hypothetical protein [Deltaproteobacteria bacterium]